MSTALEILFNDFYRRDPRIPQNDAIVRNYEALLKANFSKRERKFLLHLENRLSLLAYEWALRAFTEGFRLGLSMNTLNNQAETNSFL